MVDRYSETDIQVQTSTGRQLDKYRRTDRQLQEDKLTGNNGQTGKLDR